MHKLPRFALKQTFARIDFLRWVVGWWITMALIMLKFLLKNRQNIKLMSWPVNSLRCAARAEPFT
ncbi:hypothetical protein HMPREF2955_09140 [Prevotella sp. HMSC073D09]|nr:hypothetical protein HMPREF2955_09140 [Prevotella sp. HMSC073D09]